MAFCRILSKLLYGKRQAFRKDLDQIIAEEDQAVVRGSSLSTNFWKVVSKPSS
jgi:hypothetical protein